MKKVAGVNFRENGRIYYFDPNNIDIKLEDKVIVETKMGKELRVYKNSK